MDEEVIKKGFFLKNKQITEIKISLRKMDNGIFLFENKSYLYIPLDIYEIISKYSNIFHKKSQKTCIQQPNNFDKQIIYFNTKTSNKNNQSRDKILF